MDTKSTARPPEPQRRFQLSSTFQVKRSDFGFLNWYSRKKEERLNELRRRSEEVRRRRQQQQQQDQERQLARKSQKKSGDTIKVREATFPGMRFHQRKVVLLVPDTSLYRFESMKNIFLPSKTSPFSSGTRNATNDPLIIRIRKKVQSKPSLSYPGHLY